MPVSYIELEGEVVAPQDLCIEKARELARVLQIPDFPHARLLECRRMPAQDKAEAVIFEVDVQVAQRRENDIRPTERVAVVFDKADRRLPETLALRSDFPMVPHLNLGDEEYPRSLCLYDKPYRELKLSWTPAAFVTRIREWLAHTAKGDLHARDQQLEPFILGSPWYLILPSNLFEETTNDITKPLFVEEIRGGGNKAVLVAKWEPTKEKEQEPQGIKLVATTIKCAPQTHGVIRKRPRNLQELHEFLEAAHVDLIGHLRSLLRSWEGDATVVDAQLVLVVALPKTREAGGAVEETETWAFLCGETIGQIREEIGIWASAQSSGTSGLLLVPDETKRGGGVKLDILNPVFTFNRRMAARLNGLEEANLTTIVAVGMGALGSQVLTNLMRAGYGTWTLIDSDVLLPHNLARHALWGNFVGLPKAATMAVFSRMTIAEEDFGTSIDTDVMEPMDDAQQLQIDAALSDANVILDMSASMAVSRHLARDVRADGRRVSMFLNPSGSDLVLLVEDAARTLPIDFLEMQYYRELVNNPALLGHFRESDSLVRYGISCSDISSTLPQHLVGMHAAIGAGALQQALLKSTATAAIWHADQGSLSVSRIDIPATEISEQKIDGWLLYTDQWLLEKVALARRGKLPNETGGVLVGAFDTQHKVIYVVDMVPSPPDSQEWPTLYIRGHQDLKTAIERIASLTGGALGYVGEWHSHPQGHGCGQSDDDRKVLSWLADEMKAEGLPGLMLIMGDGEHGWYSLQGY